MNPQMYAVYTTGLTVVTAAAGGAGSANITIEAGTDFEVHFLSGQAVQVGLVVTNWSGTVQVNYNRTNTTFFNSPVLFMEVAGDGRQLYPLRKPQLIKANSVLVVTWANNSLGTATSATLSLHGYKVPTMEKT